MRPNPASPNTVKRDREDRPAIHRGVQVQRALAEDLPSWGVLVLESHHASGFTMTRRTHNFLKVVYFLEGAGSFHVGPQNYRFQAGDLVVVPVGTENQLIDAKGTPSSLYAGCFSDSLFQDDDISAAVLNTPHHLADRHPTAAAVATLLRRMMFIQEQAKTSARFDMLVDGWKVLKQIADFSLSAEQRSPDRSPKPGPRRDSKGEQYALVEHYIAELAENFLQTRSIDEAAAHCGISRRTFTSMFREITGTTWLQYVRNLAIGHAVKMLEQTDLPITSIAFECGFEDLSTFYRQFSRQMNRSPAAHRRSINKHGVPRPQQ